ncbi:hypothetical protein B0H14DRAFT_2488532 [Mycena olivaceomarginata]|nr:hypothetical protein B0H14DRAFT_2488532 [Mycena olivaceomarginata]
MLSFETLVKQLQGTPNESECEILAILTALQRNFQINETLLKDCQGSLTVGRLRYHVSPSISSLAEEIVKDWKALVAAERTRHRTIWARNQAPTVIAGITSTSQKRTSKQGGKLRSSPVYIGLTGDKTRNTCIEMLYDTLAFDSGAPFDFILCKATEIEAAVHKEHRNGLYFTATQTVFRCLQDEDNSALREEVVSGDLPVERFLQMAGCGYRGPSAPL